MSEWKISGYKAELSLDKNILETGEVSLNRDAARYFGLGEDGSEDKRLIFFYEGREYPSFAENTKDSKLTLSKALTSKLIGVFPNFKEYFDENPEEIPALSFDKKSSDEFNLKFILPWNESIAKKQDFFEYLGTGTEPGNLRDAYDILFIRELFDNMDNKGFSDVFMISAKIKKALEKRFDETGETDRQAKKAIDNIKEAGLDKVLSFLMENQYSELAAQNYLYMQQVGDHFMFRLEPDLFSELSTDDRRFIVMNMDNTLDHYFARQDAPSLSESLDAFMFDYNTFFNKDFRYSFKDVITDAIPAGLLNLGLIDTTKYRVVGFPGKETWAVIPYVSINDLEYSRLNDTGLYIAYVLNKDKQILYLALLIGYLPIEEELKAQGLSGDDLTSATTQILAQTAQGYRNQMSFGTFSKDTEKVELADPRYQSGVIAYKNYSKIAPSDETIRSDLEELLTLYAEALTIDPNAGIMSIEVIEETPEPEIEPETLPDVKEKIEESDNHIENPELELIEPEAEREESDLIEEETLEETLPENPLDEDVIQSEAIELSGPVEAENEVEVSIKLEEEPTDKKELLLSRIQELKNSLDALEPHDSPAADLEDIIAEGNQDTTFGILGNLMGIKRPRKHQVARTRKVHPESIVSREAIENVRELLSENKDIVHGRRHINLQKFTRTPELTEYVEPENTKEVMENLEKYISAHGYTPADNIVKDLYLSLKTYPMAAITGANGSSLDKFIRLYARSLGATFENGRFLQTRVKNTKDTTDKMFGYYNPYSALFTEGVLTDFILHAVEEPDAPFFIYLKDLPLNRHEDFLGELMTIYDTRRRYDDEVITDPILRMEQFGNDEEALSRYNGLYLPDNLFIIAGLAKDDYTEQELALLDHISVLNVKVGSLKLTDEVKEFEATPYGSQFLHGDLLSLSENESEKDMIRDVIVLLEAINSILGRISAQIGPRERDEICLFLLYNAQERLLSQDEALDLAILQKIIPRIYGKGDQVESVITDLFKICAGTRSNEAVHNYPGSGGLFPNSALKLSQMINEIDNGKIASVFS